MIVFCLFKYFFIVDPVLEVEKKKKKDDGV